MYKQGDRITRAFTRHRGRDVSTTHTYEIFSGVFNFAHRPPEHIRLLLNYLRTTFLNGAPMLTHSCSTIKVGDVRPYQSVPLENYDLIKYAKMSMCQGYDVQVGDQSYHVSMGDQQHPLAQEYLMMNDPFTVGLEIPVYSLEEDRTGFIDGIRILPDTRIELIDFKPDIPKGMKKGKLGVTKKQNKIEHQVSKYKDLLCALTGIPEMFVRCVYFDHEAAYEIH